MVVICATSAFRTFVYKSMKRSGDRGNISDQSEPACEADGMWQSAMIGP